MGAIRSQRASGISHRASEARDFFSLAFCRGLGARLALSAQAFFLAACSRFLREVLSLASLNRLRDLGSQSAGVPLRSPAFRSQSVAAASSRLFSPSSLAEVMTSRQIASHFAAFVRRRKKPCAVAPLSPSFQPSPVLSLCSTLVKVERASALGRPRLCAGITGAASEVGVAVSQSGLSRPQTESGILVLK